MSGRDWTFYDGREGPPRTLYDEIDAMAHRPACPECHRRTREALQLGLIFALTLFGLGGFIGWMLHAVAHRWGY